MTGRHPGRQGRLFACGAALLAAFVLLGLAGCSSKSKSFTFPPEPEPTSRPWLLDIWGSGANDIYVVGRPGILLHWDGTAWSLQDLGTSEILTAVWGTGPSDVFVVGYKGLVYHYDGSGWSLMNSGTTRDLYAVGRGPGDGVYICGDNAVLFRLEAGTWQDTPDTAVLYNPAGTATVDTLVRSFNEIAALTNITPYAISGSDGVALMTDVRPTRWRRGPIGISDWLNVGWGGANISDNWLASDTGKLFRLQSVFGTLSWLEVSSPATIAVDDMWGTPDALTYYFVTRDGQIVRRSADGTSIVVVYSSGFWLSGIWGSAANDIYAVGYDATMLHWDGSTWSTVTVPVPAAKSLPAGAYATDKFGRPLD
ncbi:MAG: beta propeller repeat protein [Candidatus Krumholzibacteriia bacterium]